MKITFASCANVTYFKSQPQWSAIEAQDPDYLFLLGDQIYMDFSIWPLSSEPIGSPEDYTVEKFRKTMQAKYEAQWNVPEFKQLFDKMKAKNAVFGVWDDHDFAWDNAYGTKVDDDIKVISRNFFHHYMGSDESYPTYPEIYRHIDIPMARVIFLDNRYHATPPCKKELTNLVRFEDPECINRKLIGDKQFSFLEEKLNHDQQYTIICAGLTLTHGTSNWSNYDFEYQRFKELIKDKPKVLFLAGDIHKNRFSKPDSSRPCYEIASSGIAIKLIGLPGKLDNIHNWGMLEYNDNEVLVSLHNKNGTKKYSIDANTWESQQL